MEAWVGLGMNCLDASGVIDVRHCRNFGTPHVELIDAKQRLYFGRHLPALALHDVSDQQHIRAFDVELEPVGEILAQDCWGEWTERFAIFDLEVERRLHAW